MESWMIYGFIAAILIASRDIFTKHYSTKYSVTEHILYYYVLCGFFIVLYAGYQRYYKGETIRCIETEDIWKYSIIAILSIALIAPCETLAIKKCNNPGKSKTVVNLNSLFAFIFGILFLKQTAFSMRTLFGILLTISGIYFVI